MLRRGEFEGTSRENKIECIMQTEHAPYSVCEKRIEKWFLSNTSQISCSSEWKTNIYTAFRLLQCTVYVYGLMLIWILIFARNQFICQAFRCIPSHGDKAFIVFFPLSNFRKKKSTFGIFKPSFATVVKMNCFTCVFFFFSDWLSWNRLQFHLENIKKILPLALCHKLTQNMKAKCTWWTTNTSADSNSNTIFLFIE